MKISLLPVTSRNILFARPSSLAINPRASNMIAIFSLSRCCLSHDLNDGINVHNSYNKHYSNISACVPSIEDHTVLDADVTISENM